MHLIHVCMHLIFMLKNNLQASLHNLQELGIFVFNPTLCNFVMQFLSIL